MSTRQDEKMKEKMAEEILRTGEMIEYFTEQFKSEMMDKFEELGEWIARQDERIAEQEQTILTQDRRILQQDEKIAQIKEKV